MNALFNKLVGVLRKFGPGSNAVPFNVGRIYKCVYNNWKHDPQPMVLVLASDAFYTVGINVHYVQGYTSQLINVIMLLRSSQRVITGGNIYHFLKLRVPQIPKIAYRKYFTSMLRGTKVSEGISTAPEIGIQPFVGDAFVRELNRRIHPPILRFNTPTALKQEEIETARNQIGYIQIKSQKPAAAVTQQNAGPIKPTSIQYRPTDTGGNDGNNGAAT
jgi:hypothetical protein